MLQSSSILRKLGSDSSPSNISSETSSALQVLLDRVKPVWADAQGDRGESSVNRVEPLSVGFCWLRVEPTSYPNKFVLEIREHGLQGDIPGALSQILHGQPVMEH